MKLHTATLVNLDYCERQCPGYTLLLKPAIVERGQKRIVIDLEHPAAIQAGRARAEALSEASTLSQVVGVAKAGVHAAKSLAKTRLGVDRLSDEQIVVRLDVCRACPGGHATFKKGDVHTCGPMLKSMRQKRRKTCGCILRSKARDRKENCPFGYWPDVADSAPGHVPPAKEKQGEGAE